MNADDTPSTSAAPPAAAPKRPARSVKKAAAARPARKRPSARKSAPAKPRKAAPAPAPGLLDLLASRVAELGDALSTLTGEGARATRDTYEQAAKAARQATNELSGKWKKMDTSKKAQVVAGILAALAAAIATPLALSRRKKKRKG